jgi:hypothetical protein
MKVFDEMFGDAYKNNGGDFACMSCHVIWTSDQCKKFAQMLSAAEITMEELNSPDALKALGFEDDSGWWVEKNSGVGPYCMPCFSYRNLLILVERMWRKKHPDL